jgi:hypothetical protein
MIFFFLGKKGHKGTLKAPNIMLKNTIGAKKYVGDVEGVYMVEDILYFIFYMLFKPQGVSRAIRKHDRKNVVGCWKGPQKVFLG